MNLQPYFDAVDFDVFAKDISYNWKYSFGANVEKHTQKFRDGNVKHIEIALVGVPFCSKDINCEITDVPDRIRKEIYQLAGQGKVNIIDFGNLKPASSYKGNYLALRDVVDYLKELGIVTVILGGSQDFSYGVCQAYRNNKFFSFCTIDAFLDVKKGKEPFNSGNYLSRVFSSQPNIFQFSLVGYQSHYVPEEYFVKVKGINTNIRLGQLRDDIAVAEPIFRNSDFLSFDFAAFKHTDAPSEKKMPNGLHSEEACQLAKYAGLGNRLNVFGLFGIDENVPDIEISVQLAAQVVWYFIEGFLKRSTLLPGGGVGFDINKVEIAELNEPLIFYKNAETNQWWLQVQSITNEITYIACTEKEFNEACCNEIPEFWLKYVQKIDELLK
ncbi:hypothetical protein OU798_10420 [Prolixibacteraceae bacterium Z1-6]|uniref:Arginase n=1 Tax=Draconibacterium aestuarii TaxID=2998507 RepID=A0A9X3F5S3_9BACT|nr:hypothetical protein [Prolixibacteraceae bacterium Z1-6]